MREIKFRAWDERYKNFQLYDLLAYHTDIPQFYKMPVMQYTGLKDKNGVEIYEGDFLQLPNGDKYIVRFGPLKGFSHMKNQMEDVGVGYELSPKQAESSEVLGHIFDDAALKKHKVVIEDKSLY